MLFILVMTIFSPLYAQAACTFPQVASRLWNNVESDLIVDISILSKVDILGSAIDNIASSISGLSSSFDADIETIASLVQDIDTRVINIESTVDELSSFIICPVESKINIIEVIDQSILSLAHVIDTRTEDIYSLDQDIASFIDLELATDEIIFSYVMLIDAKINNLNINCSGVDQIIQMDQSILSLVNVIDIRTSSIYSLDNTISSYVQGIDQQVITSQSTLNELDTFIRITIESELDAIGIADKAIQSVAQVIETRTNSIYSLDQMIASKVDVYTTLAETIQSVVNDIDSKLDNLNCIASLSEQLAQLDQSILSTVMVIDVQTSSIQSVTDIILGLDQTISNDLSSIIDLQQSTDSKIDLSIAIDTTIESLLTGINSFLDNPCSNLAELVQIDQSILSIVNVIETKTNTLQSQVQVLYELDQSILSKVDVDVDINATTASTVDVINSRTNLIESNIATISQVTNENASLVDSLSACCTGTINANTVLTSLYNSVIADQSYDNISISFQYGIPSNTINTYTQGGATITNANSMAILSTAASANSIAQVQTKGAIVYRSGHDAYAYFSVAFTGSFAATSSQFIGPIDYQNGFAVGFDGTTFGITRRANTVNHFTPQSQFNGDKLDGTGPSQFTYNPAALNIFRIAYGYLGASIIQFQILGSYNNWITFHTIQYPNTAITPSILQPFLPVTARVENLTGTSVLTLQTASWNAGIVGEPNSNSYRYFQFNNTVTTASTAETLVFTLQNNTIFSNQPNKIAVRIAGIGGAPVDTVASVNCTLLLKKNATVTGTSFSNVSAGNSVLSVSTAGTYSAGTGTIVWGYPMQTQGNGFGPFFFMNSFLIMLLPGETVTLTTQAYTGQITGIVLWEEQF